MNQNLPKNQFEQMISQQNVLRKKYATAGEWCRWRANYYTARKLFAIHCQQQQQQQ